MKFLSLIGIIAITCTTLAFADNESKVKLTGTKILSVDGEFFKNFILKVVEGNATHNFLHIGFDVVKDLPADSLNVYEIYRATKGTSTYQKISGFSVSLCSDKNSKFNQYLSNDLQKIKQSATCGLKAHYDNPRAGTVKFYNLLTEEQLKNGSFKTINGLKSGDKYLYREQLEFESN